MKLAHLILAHKDPILLERLVKRLQHKDADIFIQLDKNSNMEDFKYLEATGAVFIEKREVSGWCNYGVVKATFNGFEQILALKNDYTHINLISGQDYPIKPIAYIHQYLFANPGKSFMRAFSIADNEWEDGKDRFTKYSFGDLSIPFKYKLQGLANAILPARKLPNGLKPYGGSQWMAITPEAAQYVLDYIKLHPNITRYFRLVWAVDEVFFQTILMNYPANKDKVIQDNLRFIEVDAGKRPIHYDMTYADKLTQSKELFARKFDRTVNTDILDYLDTIIDATAK
jgi:hypothetical protein